ncbi:MAG: hypothetical protein EHM93_19620 [Bacteroidales bacterium]|nr:MAG: hypothetical protein EHM93_19620 [Bacteroidales bacterium]
MKKTVVALSIIMSFLMSQAQETIKISGISISLNDLPLNRSYQIKESTLKDAKTDTTKAKPHTIFASNHKNHIAVVSTQNAIRKIKNLTDETIKETTLEMYDKKGHLKWKAQKDDYAPYEGKISDNSGKSSFIWYSSLEYYENRILSLYDNDGREVFTDDNIYFWRSDENNDIVFYMKDQYLTKNKDDANTLYCYNSVTKNKWSKKFESSKPFTISTVAGNGSYVLCGLVSDTEGSVLYCVNNKGEISWNKEFKENLGAYRIDYKGDYILRVRDNTTWEFYNGKGELQFIKGVVKFLDFNFKPHYGQFIKNDEKTIGIVSKISYHKSIIAFYDLKGNLLDNILVPYEGVFYIELYPDNKYHVFVEDKYVLDYTKKWTN